MSGTGIEDIEPKGGRRIPLAVAVVVVLATFLSILGALKAFGREYNEWSASPTAPTGARVYLTGDSITYWSAPIIGDRRPGWFIEGVPGRQVQTLALQVEQILAGDPHPRAIIVALGTNTEKFEDYEALYRDALAPVPAGTKVVLVAPYRNPEKFGAGTDWPANRKAYHQYYAARAMNTLAQAEGVCVAHWRYTVSRNPDLLHDGIHPTMRGRRVLTELLVDAVKTCA